MGGDRPDGYPREDWDRPSLATCVWGTGAAGLGCGLLVGQGPPFGVSGAPLYCGDHAALTLGTYRGCSWRDGFQPPCGAPVGVDPDYPDLCDYHAVFDAGPVPAAATARERFQAELDRADARRRLPLPVPPETCPFWAHCGRLAVTTPLEPVYCVSHTPAGPGGTVDAMEPKEKFSVGDVVRLNSGGPTMTVESVAGERAVLIWIPTDLAELQRTELPVACLRDAVWRPTSP